MERELIKKIRENEKLHEYLITHSSWYNLLNRNSKYYIKLMSEYKQYNRNKNFDKINTTIDNAEFLSNIIKMMD